MTIVQSSTGFQEFTYNNTSISLYISMNNTTLHAELEGGWRCLKLLKQQYKAQTEYEQENLLKQYKNKNIIIMVINSLFIKTSHSERFK